MVAAPIVSTYDDKLFYPSFSVSCPFVTCKKQDIICCTIYYPKDNRKEMTSDPKIFVPWQSNR